MNEPPKYAPPEAAKKMSAEKKALIGVLIAWNLMAWGGLGYMVTHFDQFFPPENSDNTPPAAEILPTRLPGLATSTRVRPNPTPWATETAMPKNFFRIGPFNLEGFFENGHFRPAPRFFLSDGQGILAYATPKALEESDDPDTVFNWQNPINASFLNVTGKNNEGQEGFVLEVCHSGRVPLVGDLPCQKLLTEIEGDLNSPLTKDQFDANIAELKGKNLTVTQGKLMPGTEDKSAKVQIAGLTETVTRNAKIKGVMRLNPQQTAAYLKALKDSWDKPGVYANVLDFVDSDDKVKINPETDIVLFFCGEKLKPKEKAVPGVPYYLTTRYMVVVSLTK